MLGLSQVLEPLILCISGCWRCPGFVQALESLTTKYQVSWDTGEVPGLSHVLEPSNSKYPGILGMSQDCLVQNPLNTKDSGDIGALETINIYPGGLPKVWKHLIV